MSTTDDWLYSDDLDVGVSEDHLGSPDSRVLDDGEDLLDDVLTAPSHLRSNHAITNEDELLGVVGIKQEEETMEDSGSARFNAEQLARTVQARIDAHRTSHGAASIGGGTTIYSREPNRKNSVFIGNLTWWTTDLDLMAAVKEAGLREIVCIKFYENRANGQSKGYALVELGSDTLAVNAGPKLEELTIHNQKPVVMYALKISPHQFETKCNAVKAGGGVVSSSSITGVTGTSSTSTKSFSSSRPPTSANLPVAPPIQPPGLPPGFPPLPGFRPPNLPGSDSSSSSNSGGLGLMGPVPPIPPPGLPGIPPGLHPFNFLGRPGGIPGLGLPPFPPGGLGGTLEQIKAAGNAPHLNPAFLQEMATQNAHESVQKMAELFDRFRQQAGAASRLGQDSNGGKHQASEEEIADANQRNRAISSSAINRALSDANSGDYESAVDMLRMAITLIKQSVTSGSETSQILIQSLQDCLHGIEEQASMAKRPSRRDHRSHDDRERSRGSSHRSSKHHRDRSRERRR